MSTVDITRNIDVDPKNLGAFIGTKGSNYKKMIKEMKLRIIGSQPSSEEWSSVVISLKFEPRPASRQHQHLVSVAVLSCKREHVDTVFEVIDQFIVLHKKEFEDYKTKDHTKKLVYRIGKEHKFIPRLIGIGGSIVMGLKRDLNEVSGIERVGTISIEPQQGRMNPPFTNLGDRGSFETITMVVKFQGRPRFEDIHEIVSKFIEHHTSEPDTETESDASSDDYWGSAGTGGGSSAGGWGSSNQSNAGGWTPPEPEPEPEPERRGPYSRRRWEKTAPNEFDILGIPQDSDLSTIKKAFRKLAKVHHPDKGGDEEMFKKIQEAYEKLTKQ